MAIEKLLADKDIALDSRKYTMDEDFIKSNLASIDNIDEVFVTREDKDYAIQMMLSKINYLRRIKSTNTKNFKQVGYILLSGNSRTLFFLHPSDSIKKKRSQDFYSSTQSLMIRSHGRCRPCEMYHAIDDTYLRTNSTSIKGRAIIAIVALIGR